MDGRHHRIFPSHFPTGKKKKKLPREDTFPVVTLSHIFVLDGKRSRENSKGSVAVSDQICPPCALSQLITETEPGIGSVLTQESAWDTPHIL